MPQQQVSWGNLPAKAQLALLGVCRFVDFFQVQVVQILIYYQLKRLAPSERESTILWQVGIIQGAFTAAQAPTTVIWGHIIDKDILKRRTVVFLGLLTTGLSMISFAFADSFIELVYLRLAAGAFNAIAAVLRTMIPTTIGDERFIHLGYVSLTIAMNLATICGPLLVAFQSPRRRVWGTFHLPYYSWIDHYPFAVPEIVSGVGAILLSSVILFSSREHKLRFHEHDGLESPPLPCAETCSLPCLTQRRRSAWNQRLDTIRNKLSVLGGGNLWILASQAIFDFHVGGFNTAWVLFISSPSSAQTSNQHHPETRSGLGLSASALSYSLAYSGVVGILCQLFLYPALVSRFKALRTCRSICLFFPVIYLLPPCIHALGIDMGGFVSLVALIALMVGLHTCARAIVLPSLVVLTNEAVKDKSTLGKVHGMSQSVTGVFRTFGSISSGTLYAVGLKYGLSPLVWMVLAASAIFGFWSTIKIES